MTLAAPKLPLVLPPAENHAGDIVIADIGIPIEVIEALEGPRLELLTRSGMRELVSPRTPDGHKGDYGHVLIVAGSTGKTGAAHLSAMGALRSGAGLVSVATPAACLPIVAAMAPEYMTVALGDGEGLESAGVDAIIEMARDVIAIGPGLGQAPSTRRFVKSLVEQATPLVIDAGRVERVLRRSRSPDWTRGPRCHHHHRIPARWRGSCACRPRVAQAAWRSPATSPSRTMCTSC